jgi:hypothetical protein
VRAELARVLLTSNVTLAGLSEHRSLVVVLRVTNTGREPYTLNTASIACWLELVWRMGPLLGDAGMSDRLILQRGGRLISETSGFDGVGVHAHLTSPLVRWSVLPTAWLFGLYGGGEAQYFNIANF